MKSVTRIAFPLIALASAVFTSCGGGGGGQGENYVSVEDFIGGKGFRINLANIGTLDIRPTEGLGYYINSPEVSARIINQETGGHLQLPEGTEKGIVIPGGTIDISTKTEDGDTVTTNFGEIRYYVFDGSPRHGILYIPSVSRDSAELERIARALHLESRNDTDPVFNFDVGDVLSNISITVDFTFNGANGRAALYFNGRVKGTTSKYPLYKLNVFDFDTL